MYKLGFLTLVLSSNTAQVICEDNGLDKCEVPQVPGTTVVCDDKGVDGRCVTTTAVCDDHGVDGTCVTTTAVCDDKGDDSSTCVTSTSTLTSKPSSTFDAKQGSISSFAEKNSAMYVFGLLPLLLL
jgi:hypothetical protein